MSRQHAIAIGPLRAVPDMSGALFVPEENLLLVADLHLEQGASLARRGLHVPPYDTQATLAQLEQVLTQTGARRMILLGDSFHDAKAHVEIDAPDRSRLQAITSRVDTIWITGNHDPSAPQGLGGTTVDELWLGNVRLCHIPTSSGLGHHEIAGHLHPGASVIQRGHRIHAKCFVSDGRRIIMPAFGTYTGALSVTARAFSGLLDEPATRVWMIGRAAIHTFPYSRLA